MASFGQLWLCNSLLSFTHSVQLNVIALLRKKCVFIKRFITLTPSFQHVPIYEEIDGGSSFYGGGRLYGPAASEMEFSSEQGEVGSVERLANSAASESRSPRLFPGNLFNSSCDADNNVTPHHRHRPFSSATSHSQNSSQQTTTRCQCNIKLSAS